MNKGGRVGFQGGGDTSIVSTSNSDPSGDAPIIADPSDPTKVLAADPTVVAAAQANRLAAAAGDPSATPAAQAAVANSGLSGADQSTAPRPTVEDTVNAGQKYGEQSFAQATQQAQRVIGGQEAPKPFWKNPDFLIPAFTGIADMLAAPTKYPLVAAFQGLKGGAQAYQGMRSYDASQALSEQDRSALGLGETTQAYQGATQRRQVNAQIAGQLLGAFDQNYKQDFTRMSEDGSGPSWLGPRGYITNSQHAALRSQIMQSTYGGLAQSGEAAGPIGALPLVMGGAGVGPATGGAPSAVVTPSVSAGGGGGGGGAPPVVSSPAGGPSGASVDQAPGGLGHPASSAGGSGAATPAGAVGGGGHPAGGPPAGGGAQGPAAAAPQIKRRPGEDQIDFRARRGDYASPVQVTPVLSREDAATQLTDDTNPYELQDTGDAAAQQKAAAIFHGDQPAQLKSGGEYAGFRQRQASQARYDQQTADNAAEWTHRQAQARQWSQNAAQQQQYITALAGDYRNFNPATISPEIANAVGVGASIPGVRDLIPQNTKNWQSDVATATKLSHAQQMVLAQQMHGAPATGLQVAGTTVPGPDQPVDTRYEILNQSQAQLDWQRAKNAAEAKLGGNMGNWDKFDQDFLAAHPLSEFEGKAHIPFFKGQSMESMKRYAYVPTKQEYEQNLRPGDPYIQVVNGKRQWAIKGQGGG
jgi:hypothetical protein